MSFLVMPLKLGSHKLSLPAEGTYPLLLSCVFTNLAAASPQEAIKSDSKIQNELKEKLKLASLGKPSEFATYKERVQKIAQEQVNGFIERLDGGNDHSQEVADNLRSSMTFVEELTRALQYELENEPMPRMESISFRDTLGEIGIHIASDYSFVMGATPAGQKLVRICLPDLHACPGCKKKLEQALTEVKGFEDALVDLETLTAQFSAPADFDVGVKLDSMKKSVAQLKKWKLVRE